jgi:hypothetical protein
MLEVFAIQAVGVGKDIMGRRREEEEETTESRVKNTNPVGVGDR